MRYTGDPWPKLWFQWGEGLRVSAVGRGGTRAKKRNVFPFLIHSFTHFCKRGPARSGHAACTPARCVFWSQPEWGGLLGWTGGPTLALEKWGRQVEAGASLEELRRREPPSRSVSWTRALACFCRRPPQMAAWPTPSTSHSTPPPCSQSPAPIPHTPWCTGWLMLLGYRAHRLQSYRDLGSNASSASWSFQTSVFSSVNEDVSD